MLFENEDYIRTEVGEALGRIVGGTFGTCERCGTEIMEERLEVLPYTRYCTPCSAEVGDGARLGGAVGDRVGGGIAAEFEDGSE
jgi:RNA polymerase-binding transcription factor DksA